MDRISAQRPDATARNAIAYRRAELPSAQADSLYPQASGMRIHEINPEHPVNPVKELLL